MPNERARGMSCLTSARSSGKRWSQHSTGHSPVEEVHQCGERFVRTGGISSSKPAWDPAPGAAGEREEAVRVAGEGVEGDGGIAARRVHARPRDEGAQVAVSLARLGQRDEVRALAAGEHGQFGAQDAGQAQFTRREGEAHRAAQVVVVRQRERRHA
jgi:hypothetical protein